MWGNAIKGVILKMAQKLQVPKKFQIGPFFAK
jgi:hypothetical protein